MSRQRGRPSALRIAPLVLVVFLVPVPSAEARAGFVSHAPTKAERRATLSAVANPLRSSELRATTVSAARHPVT